MDAITYDFSRLDLDGMLELQELQGKMREATGSIEGYSALSVDELLRLEDLHYKMAGIPNPRKRTPEHVPVIPSWYSGVPAASNPPAVAPAPPVNTTASVTPAPAPAAADKPKLPADTALSAARQLDSILRFGYDLPEEPR